MKARYCSASARIEMRWRSTFWRRASSSSRSSGPSKPSTSTSSAGSPSRSLGRSRHPRRVRALPSVATLAIRASALGRHRKRRIEPGARIHRIERLRLVADAPSAASARRSGHCPPAPATRLGDGTISSIRPLQWSTTSHPAREGGSARSRNDPDSACIDRSSLMTRPSKPICPRMISPMTAREVVAGRSGSIAV